MSLSSHGFLTEKKIAGFVGNTSGHILKEKQKLYHTMNIIVRDRGGGERLKQKIR
jgi:hypothetical protein